MPPRPTSRSSDTPAQRLGERSGAVLAEVAKRSAAGRSNSGIPLALGHEPLQRGAQRRVARAHLIEQAGATLLGCIEYGIDERGQPLPVVRQERLPSSSGDWRRP